MSEDIWKKSLGIEDSSTYKEKNLECYQFEMNKLNLRNYINVHTVDEINIQTLRRWFREDSLYKPDDQGHYIQHLACGVTSVPFEKRYKLLEEIFKIIHPNMGRYGNLNYNYFQYCLLISRLVGIDYKTEELLKLYELGIKNGMDENYLDDCGQLMSHYLAAISWYSDVNGLFDVLILNKNFKNNYHYTPKEILENRLQAHYLPSGTFGCRMKKSIPGIDEELSSIYGYEELKRSLIDENFDTRDVRDKIKEKILKLK